MADVVVSKVKCPKCKREFKNSAGLGRHMQTHQPKAARAARDGKAHVDKMLQQMFPDGVPVNKLRKVNEWTQLTDELLRG